ncbi:quinon protein alcohol dehydrogenase-like superfamily [Aspergillus alliaceus]|uniref:Mitochondrial division protein 1 n=1 Tax=Petromyces alliaceus TaxID=209559 RepID=A0A5N7CJK8_PETAA|nr:quinon protein alcohol dehydrogenase-like superfamily [Aspergillus alliaceus]
MGFHIKQLFRKGRGKKSKKPADGPSPDEPNASVTSSEPGASPADAGPPLVIEGSQNGLLQNQQDLWQAAYVHLDPDDQHRLSHLHESNVSRSVSRESQMVDIVNAVIKTTEKRYDEYQRKGLKIKRSKGADISIRDSALKIVSATLSFQDIIGAVIACDPTGYSGKVWGLVSVGLTMIQNHQDLQASIFQTTEFLTDVLSRCAFIETHCLGSKSSDTNAKDMLRNAIIRVYTAILRYSARIVSVQESGAASRFCLSVTAMTDQPLSALKIAIKEEEGYLEKWVQFNQQLVWKEKAETILSQIDNVLSGIQDISREMELCKLTIAEGAAFDSYMNQHEVECLPGTRTDLLKQIIDWSHSPHGECVFWLNGMAGTGKSTVSRTVCKLLQENGLLGASFFFKRGKSDCGKAEKFFPTIVRQMITQEPRLIPAIRRAIQRDPSISTKSLREQFNKLLLEPLLSVKDDQVNPCSVVIVVDALDECDPENDIGLLLRLLPMISTQGAIGIRLFLTSRPEIPVRQGFDSISKDDHQSLSLHEIVESSIKRDILLFINDRFEEMRRKLSLPQEWPGEKIIQDLVNMASPLFISAATMCRFIGDRRWDPKTRLAIVLGLAGSENVPTSYISKLEHTYIPVFEQILHSEDGEEDEDERQQLVQEYRMIVGTIIVISNPLSLLSLAKLLNVPSSDVGRRLDFLHSVLSIPDDRSAPIQLFHQSFRDFLLHPKVRAKTEFWVDEEHTHKETLFRCIEVMTRERGGLSRNICGLSSDGAVRTDISDATIQDHLPAELQYSCHYWIYHLQRGRYQIADQDRIHNFLETHFLHWLEAMSILGLASEVVGSIRTLQSAVQPGSGRLVSKFLHDANRFILKNAWIINNAPLQLYASALIFAPQKSIIRRAFQSEISGRFVRLPQVEDNWDAQLMTLDIMNPRVVAFSPDSKLIASASIGTPVKLWDSITGLLLHTLESAILTSALAFSPDNNHLAYSTWDDTIEGHIVQLWDINTGTLDKTFEENACSVIALAFSPDNTLLASGSLEHTVDLWGLATGAVFRTLQGHSGLVNAVAISPDGRLIASGSTDKTVKLWELDTGAVLRNLEHSEPVVLVGFSPDNQLIVSGSLDGTIWIWDATTGKLRQTFDSGFIELFAISPSSTLETSGSVPPLLWGMVMGALYYRFDWDTRHISTVALSPNRELLVSRSDDGSVRLWDATLIAEQKALQDHSDEIVATVLSPDAKLLASVSGRQIQLWDFAKGILLHTVDGYCGKSTTFGFSPDSRMVALRPQSDSTCVQLWDTATGQISQTLEGHLNTVDRIIFSPSGQHLASIDEDGTITLWVTHTGERLYSLESYGNWACIAFSPSGKKLASSAKNAVRVWGTATGVLQQELEEHQNKITALKFSPDEQLLASGSNDAKVRLWNLTTGALSQTLQDIGAVNQVVFSPDGRLVASGTLSHTLRVWDRKTGKPLSVSEGQSTPFRNGINHLHFSDDSRYLEADFGAIRVLPLRSGQEAVPSPPLKDVTLGDQWLHIGPERVLWLPVEYRPKTSAYRDGTFAIGSESGIISFITVDINEETNGLA